MTVSEDLKQAVLHGDFARAQMLVPHLADNLSTLDEIQKARDVLAESLQMTRIFRAHDALRLAQLRSSQHQADVCEAYVSGPAR